MKINRRSWPIAYTQIKLDKQKLIDKTVIAIENLTDEEISKYLHLKWIEPVYDGIMGTLLTVLEKLENSVIAISEKYGTSYKAIIDDISRANNDLASLVSQLTGDEYSIEGLNELIKA